VVVAAVMFFRIKDVGQPSPEPERDRIQPRDRRVEYRLFYNDRPKRFENDLAIWHVGRPSAMMG